VEEDLKKLRELRKEVIEIIEPRQIEAELLNYYLYIRTKRSERCKQESSVTRANKILKMLGKEKNSSICLFMTLSLREVDKKKTTDELHKRKCHEVLSYLQKGEKLLSCATSNEQILFEKVRKLVELLVAVQCPPGEY